MFFFADKEMSFVSQQSESVSQPTDKQEKAKKEPTKEKPKPKAAATQDKKNDKNTAKNKEEEASLEKDADELRKAIEGKRSFSRF